jgi:acyl carrier protein|tara:strand:+ start:861 stop:1112 length:252 start_codon:yes stop_codon:yes gene_type:complete
VKNKRKEILKKIQPIFHKVFDNKKLRINYNSSAKTIKQWDSLAQINLVVNVEKLLKIKFSVSELANLKNVGEMIDLILVKNNG